MTWMIIRLILSLGFIAVVLLWAARLAKKKGLGQGNGVIEVVSRQRLGRTSSVNVIRIADVVLVVGATEEQVTFLAEVDAEAIDTVLAERRVPTRAVRTVAEIEQQTETGELLLRNLLRAQLALGLRLGLVAVFVLGALPVLFLVLPQVGTVEVAGVTLPWLVLGFLPYPFMLALAWLYIRTAERNELDFADNVEDLSLIHI